MPLSTLQASPHDDTCKTQGQDGIAFSFPAGLFHPLQHAGLSRRSPRVPDALRDRMVNRALDLLLLLVEAAYSAEKVELLNRASRSVNGVRYLLRLAKDLMLSKPRIEIVEDFLSINHRRCERDRRDGRRPADITEIRPRSNLAAIDTSDGVRKRDRLDWLPVGDALTVLWQPYRVHNLIHIDSFQSMPDSRREAPSFFNPPAKRKSAALYCCSYNETC
jgi:hypothetical protein